MQRFSHFMLPRTLDGHLLDESLPYDCCISSITLQLNSDQIVKRCWVILYCLDVVHLGRLLDKFRRCIKGVLLHMTLEECLNQVTEQGHAIIAVAQQCRRVGVGCGLFLNTTSPLYQEPQQWLFYAPWLDIVVVNAVQGPGHRHYLIQMLGRCGIANTRLVVPWLGERHNSYLVDCNIRGWSFSV